MKLLLVSIILLSIAVNACSHSTIHYYDNQKCANNNFTIDRRDYKKITSVAGFKLRISNNTLIDVDLKSIANFVQPRDLEETPALWPDEVRFHPWAICHIAF